MSNYLSRLVARQLSSSNDIAIQPRPVARFESVVSSTPQPLSAEPLSSQLPLTQPLTRQSEMHHDIETSQPPRRSSSNSLIDSFNDSLLLSQPFQVKAANHSVQHESGFSSDVTLPVPTLSSDIVTSLSPNPVLPLSQVTPVPQSVLEASQPMRFASVQPARVPVSLPVEMPAQSMRMPSLPPVTVSDQRPRETQERLPTPLLVSSAFPLTFSSPFAAPSTELSPTPFTAPAPATIQVTIGRIEVRATSPSTVPSAAPARPAARMSLEEYLQRRHQGKKS